MPIEFGYARINVAADELSVTAGSRHRVRIEGDATPSRKALAMPGRGLRVTISPWNPLFWLGPLVRKYSPKRVPQPRSIALTWFGLPLASPPI